jgi:hypothetical protein
MEINPSTSKLFFLKKKKTCLIFPALATVCRAVASIGETERLERLVAEREEVLHALERAMERYRRYPEKGKPTHRVGAEVWRGMLCHVPLIWCAVFNI